MRSGSLSIQQLGRRTYESGGVDGLPRILKNLQALSAYRNARGSATPKLSLWMTLMRENVHEAPDLVRIAHLCGVAEVYIQRLVFTGSALASQPHSLFGNATGEELESLRSADRLAQELGVALRGSDEAQPAEHVARGGEGPAYTACWRPWRLIYVTAQGNVLPCCIAPFAARRYQDIILGNAFESPVQAIWHGERYRAWRQGIETEQPLDPCNRCGIEWSL